MAAKFDKRAQTQTVPREDAPTHEADVGARPPEGAELAAGEVVGRYRVLRCIDRGGMGIVYEALDESLGRRVALKLLLPSAARDDPQLAAQLVREARAVAALSHPNVVQVYEVTMHGADPVIALEYVDGVDLAGWLALAPRGWREITRVFEQAGQGLAAAHRAGLVHRDVKPSNLLVGKDRVRVADFGLARAALEEGADGGTIVGTPLYMAPEQRAGRPLDARADQWSFCASLYEALAGEPPPRDGAPELPASVPGWLKRVVLRGLAADPAARHPSMEALVHELARDRRARWRLVTVGGSLALGATAVLASAVGGQEPCRGADDALGGIWNAAIKARVGEAFVSLGVPYAASLWTEVRREIKHYVADWSAMAQATCEATHVQGSQSEAMLDRRMSCLEQRRRALDVLVHDFAAIDRAGLDSALSAVRGLPRVADCGDLAYVAAGAPPRADALQARATEDLARAQLHFAAARDREGAELARRAADAWHASGDGVREAEARLMLGRLQMDVDGAGAIASLTTAADLAGAAGAVSVEIEAWGFLAQAYMRAGRMDEAARVLELAFAALARAPDRRREADLHFARGGFHGRGGRFEEARRDFERALQLYQEVLGPGSHFLNSVHANLAIALRRLGRLDEALTHAKTSLELALLLGEEHPATANARADVAIVLMQLGRHQEAVAELERAGAVMRKFHGHDSPQVAGIENSLGVALSSSGRWLEASAHHRAAVAASATRSDDVGQMLTRRANLGLSLLMTGRPAEAEHTLRQVLVERERVLGPGHADVGATRRLLGVALLELGHLDEAERELEAARHMLSDALGGAHRSVADALASLAALERRRERWEAARELDRRALEILGAALAPQHPDLVAARVAIARDELGLGAPERALPLAEQAIAAFDVRAEPARGAPARWVAAQALAALNRDGDRPLVLAREARDALLGAGIAGDLAALGQWLTDAHD